MKRLIILLGIVVALAGAGGAYFAFAGTSVAPYAPLGPGDTYLALGDSLAAGWSASNGNGYAARLNTQLQAQKPGLVFQSMAVPGETTVSFNNRQLPRALQFLAAQQKAGKRVSPITLTMGGNDARNAEDGSIAERRAAIALVRTNLGTALDRLVKATTDAQGKRTADLVVMTYYNPWGGDPANETSPAYWSNELNRAITETAAARGIPVADVATPFDNGQAYAWTNITVGDIHANNIGHEVIAKQFWQALQYGAWPARK